MVPLAAYRHVVPQEASTPHLIHEVKRGVVRESVAWFTEQSTPLTNELPLLSSQ